MDEIIQADTYQLQATAQVFTHHAVALRDQSKQVARIREQLLDGKQGWKGNGASAFSARCEILIYELEQSAEVLEMAATALQHLAIMMEQVNEMRLQANHLESLAQECSIQDVERRMSLLSQVSYLRQEGDWRADQCDRQAATAFASAMEKVPNILSVRDSEQNLYELLNSLPEPYRSYYARHQDLLAEENGLDEEGIANKKRHIFLVGGIEPDDNVSELAINNLGEMLVDKGDADSFQVVDDFTPNDLYHGIAEVTDEKLFADRHRSEDLAKMIENYHKEHPDEEIDIIAHSGGGEISKNAENELFFKGESDFVNKMISFGGADWTDPVNKKIYHITSPYDIVGVPGNIAQEALYGMNNTATEFLGQRNGKEETLVLNSGNYNPFNHINPAEGDHVNYFEPGPNLNSSYSNVVHELNSKDPLPNTSTSSLLNQNSSLLNLSEGLYYNGTLDKTIKKVEHAEEQAGAFLKRIESSVSSIDNDLLDNAEK